jgi:hypothetical protein
MGDAVSDVIVQARGILHQVREGATPGPWNIILGSGNRDRYLGDEQGQDLACIEDPADASLIVLMCSPALLDAIDGMLEAAQFNMRQRLGHTHATVAAAKRIASAIVEQWEAMSS